MYVQRNIEARWRNFCCREEATIIAYSECVFVELVVRHTKRRNIVPARPAVPYFSTLFYKRQDLKKIIEFKLCV